MSQGPLCPNLSQKVQKEVSQIANRNLPCLMLLGGLSVNLNHLKICRFIRNNDQVFGGLQVIAAGSFVQLPPVLSVHDDGKYAFQSPILQRIFPHKINLKAVHRQHQFQLVQGINELCEGIPSKTTEDLMRSLKRPIVNSVNPVYIFGTNFEVDFFNPMTLAQLPGDEHVFDAKDNGNTHAIRKCPAPKQLVLKCGCKVMLIRNLENGLVNGLSAKVTDIKSDHVIVQVEVDKHMSHKLQGKSFQVTRYAFLIRDANDCLLAKREQLPLKLGYAITVDKAQGRTMDEVVIDASNFWRPGQMGVAVGRASSTEGLSFSAYNHKASQLRHPQIVTEFYNQRSLIMKENLMCCNQASFAVMQHQFQMAQEPVQAVPLGNSNFNFLQNIAVSPFPFEVNEYIDDFIDKMPKLTGIQMEQIAILRENCLTPHFNTFLNNAYSTVLDIFTKCKISEKKQKCNWCRLCAHLHNVFSSQLYCEEIMEAFQLKKVTANANAICTRIYFDILNLISSKEATLSEERKLESYLAGLEEEHDLDSLDKSSLRYIAGACIHSVRNIFRRIAMQNVFKTNTKQKSQVKHIS